MFFRVSAIFWGLFGFAFLSLSKQPQDIISYSNSKKFKTELVVVWKDNEIIHEWYRSEESKNTAQLSWSMSKSYLNYLVYFGIRSGYLSIDDSICGYLKDYSKQDQLCDINIDHLLSMTSGLRWKEGYEKDILESSVLEMLYGKGSLDIKSYILSLGVDRKPGQRFLYSSGSSNLLGFVLRQAVESNVKWSDFLAKAKGVFAPSSEIFQEHDAKGSLIASSYLYMKPMDYIRFGRLFLKAKDFPLGVDKQWLDYSTSLAEATILNPPKDADVGPGRQWWTNKTNGGYRSWPNLPADAFAALGHWGQILMIIPSENMVFLRIAKDEEGLFQVNEFAKYLNVPRAGGSIQKPEKKISDIESGLDLNFFTKLRIASSYRAKMYCSCRFVQKKSETSCLDFVSNDVVPPWLLPVSGKNSEVKAGYWPYQKSAKFDSFKGCYLI